MMLNDWEWFQEGWTRESWKDIEERNKSLGRTSSSILDRWKKFFRGKKVQLTERIDSGEYVIVYYKVTGEKGTLFAVMRLEDGKWLITNELITDPVVISGKEGKTLIKKVIR
jgi:ribosomal protein L13